ncbi:dihydrofolate reductase [Rhodobacteraceae bacterium CCMM004]|nr:dihydrofolate reductase [Rhodobacteraceae bacterium CCMM004]
MQELVYDVAVSLDGFIAAESGDFSAFPTDDSIVAAYFDRLAGYAVSVMGRATYEVGLDHGLSLGANPYPAMDTHVVSTALRLPAEAAVTRIATDPVAAVAGLKARAAGPVYLCGGGRLAGCLAAAGLLDRLRVKRAPIVLGRGIPLFDRPLALDLSLEDAAHLPSGYVYQDFRIAAPAARASSASPAHQSA